MAALRSAAQAYAAGDPVAPCALLWPDPERLGERMTDHPAAAGPGPTCMSAPSNGSVTATLGPPGFSIQLRAFDSSKSGSEPRRLFFLVTTIKIHHLG